METPQECHTTSKNMFELPKVLQIRILWFCDALLFIDCAYHFTKSNFPKSQRVTVTQHILTQSILLILLGWQVCNNSMISFWNFSCIACIALVSALLASAREELMRDAMRRLRDQTQKSQQMFEQKLPEIINNKHCQEVPVPVPYWNSVAVHGYNKPAVHNRKKPSILANHWCQMVDAFSVLSQHALSRRFEIAVQWHHLLGMKWMKPDLATWRHVMISYIMSYISY